MRELALVGCVAWLFGLGAYYATGHFGAFSATHLLLGSVALVVALARGALGLYARSGRAARRLVLRGALGVAVSIGLAVLGVRVARWLDWRADWTFERRYEVAPATRRALEELCGPVDFLHFREPGDPRNRRTGLLLEAIGAYGDARVRPLAFETAAEEADLYGVGRSNTVVVRLRDAAGHSDHFDRVERPTEGALYEALYRLCETRRGTLLHLRGHGEGDLERGDGRGFAGLAAALATEGYALRSHRAWALEEVPAGVDAVLVVAPERALPPATAAALERFLLRGGALVAFLEPGLASGLDALLAGFGLAGSDAELRDPSASPRVPEALAARHYETHPIVDALDASRLTYFVGARSFALHKPRPDDRLRGVVYAGPETRRARGSASPPEPAGEYLPIAATGRYLREGREARIFVVGDADFASNRHLRSAYNLDLVLNGVHWALAREPAITLRPKLRDTVQFPLPARDALRSLYGAGLLVPELVLLAGGVVWLRRRAA